MTDRTDLIAPTSMPNLTARLATTAARLVAFLHRDPALPRSVRLRKDVGLEPLPRRDNAAMMRDYADLYLPWR